MSSYLSTLHRKIITVVILFLCIAICVILGFKFFGNDSKSNNSKNEMTKFTIPKLSRNDIMGKSFFDNDLYKEFENLEEAYESDPILKQNCTFHNETIESNKETIEIKYYIPGKTDLNQYKMHAIQTQTMETTINGVKKNSSLEMFEIFDGSNKVGICYKYKETK